MTAARTFNTGWRASVRALARVAPCLLLMLAGAAGYAWMLRELLSLPPLR
jgi:hypothetical protein